MAVRSFMMFESASSRPASAAEEDAPAGRELALLLAGGLEPRGLQIQEPVDQHDSYGWYFVAVAGEQAVWCMLQRSDEWLLITKPETPLLKRLLGRKTNEEAHRRVCEALHATAASPDISHIRWFSRADFEQQQPGAASP